MNIHIAQNGKQSGPYSLEDINNYISSGALGVSDLAWYEGLATWIPLSNVPGIVMPSSPPPLPPPLPERSSSEAPKLWNPNVAANWSLLFTPIFGAWIHAKNWNELEQHERGKKSMLWVYIGFAILLTVIFLPDAGARIVSFAFLISWYFSSAKSQVKYLKENNINYEKKSWGKAILLGFASLVVLFVIVAGILIATDSSLSATGLPEVPDLSLAE